MITVSIHEDYEAMRCLYPLATLDEVHAEVEVARRAEEANRAPNGVGWTDMHMIKPPKAGYGALDLRLADVAVALSAHLPKVSRFEVGFSASNPFHRAEGAGTCFGFGNALFVKLEGREDKLEAIWFDVSGTDDAHKAPFLEALWSIEEITPSIVADWWMLGVGRVSNSDFLNAYTDALWSRE